MVLYNMSVAGVRVVEFGPKSETFTAVDTGKYNMSIFLPTVYIFISRILYVERFAIGTMVLKVTRGHRQWFYSRSLILHAK